eukprot:452892_1
MTKDEEIAFIKQFAKDNHIPYWNAPDKRAIHKEICLLHCVIQSQSHDTSDTAQQARDKWCIEKPKIYSYWENHADLKYAIGIPLKNQVEKSKDNTIAVSAPGNESKLVYKDSIYWFSDLDKSMEPINGDFNKNRLSLSVKVVKNHRKKILTYAGLMDKFVNGYKCRFLIYCSDLCKHTFDLIKKYDGPMYPYEKFQFFYTRSLLPDHVQESNDNKGWAESTCQPQEGGNSETKQMGNRINNHNLKGLAYIIEVFNINKIGGDELSLYDLNKIIKTSKKNIDY